MENIVLEVPFQLDPERLLKKMKIRSAENAEEFLELVDMVQHIAVPKVLYRTAFIEARGDAAVTINGVTFRSTAMVHNLSEVQRVFPYIATCGTEVDQLGIDPSDFVRQSWLHYIKLELLTFCHPLLRTVLEEGFQVGKLASMNPGSGEASVWTINQQKGLFSLFGDVQALVGVRLTESFLMVPEVSVSGILFETEKNYANCQLCQRKDCPNRRAAFDATLWESMRTMV
ncbi:MAG: vitamin B12 dependent methionine synthase [Anaerolineae bacterium]|nr:vitamin B12 dependent methionine synthase [Anaerolineae bacterium]